MNELESPYELAALSAQSHDGVGPLVVSRAHSSIVVGACTSRRYEEQIALDIHGHDRPCVACTAPPCCVVALRDRRGRIWWKWIPAPAQSAGARVIGPNHAARHIHAVVVVNSRADDHQIIYDRGRRSHVIPARIIRLHIAQADLTGVAKIQTESTAQCVDRHQARILGGLKDSATTRLSLV